MYPKPAVGHQQISELLTSSSFSRKSACQEKALVSPEYAEYLSAFGFRSNIIQSDGYRPTNYSIYWAKRSIPRGSSGGSRSLCYGSGSTPSFTVFRQGSSLQSLHPAYWNHPGWKAMNGSSSNLVPNTMLTMFSGYRPRNASAALAYDEANNLLLLSLANQTNTIAVTLAEVSKTTRYLLDKGREIGRLLVGLKNSPKMFFRALRRNYKRMFSKGDPRRIKAANHLKRKPWDKTLGGRWLEYSYAVTPLVLEIKGVLDLNDMSTWPPIRFSVKKRKSFSFKVDAGTTQSGYASVEGNVLVQHNVEITDPLKFVLNRMGLTPSQISIGTVWELIPFSFVADWFLGLNDVFKALHAYQGLTFNHGFISMKVKGEETSVNASAVVSAEPGKHPDPGLPTISEIMGLNPPVVTGRSIVTKWTAFQRQVIPKPAGYSYSVNLDITKRRAATLLSLAAVLRK